MKGILTISILTITASIAFGQTSKVDTTFYTQSQIMNRDSVYDCDTIRMSEHYYPNWIKTDSKTYTFIENGQPQQIETRGEYLLIGERSWTQHGKWTYWDRAGKVQLETYSPNDGLGTRYLNQWLPDGNQILKNGNGNYYQVGMERITDYGLDSTVYEIKGSVKNGTYCVWCPLENGKFYKCETGQYINNVQQPLQISFYENGQVRSLIKYKNGRREGEGHRFFANGKYSEYGYYSEGLKIGNWKYWNENGFLIKECNFEKGRLKGNYTEYYPDGIIQFSGEYIHITGKDSVYIEDIMTGELTIEVRDSDDIPAKDGAWSYFNENGDLVRIENYSKGRLKKE